MRKFIILALSLAFIFTGCSKKASPADGKLHVLCSTFPLYLFTQAVTQGCENVQLDLMIPAAMGCPHDYALKPEDMRKLAGAKVLIANGLGLEEFLGDPLKHANPDLIVLDTSAGISGILPMREEPEAEPSGEHEEHQHGEFNPHLFASPLMGAAITRNIAAELSRIDPAHAETYKKNGDAYAIKLLLLADKLAVSLKPLTNRKIVTEHAVFDYLARDCGLEIVAVVEENPGSAPSAAGMLQLVQTIKASQAAAIFTEPQYPAEVSRAIAREAGIPVAALDPVATGPEKAGPDYYLEKMRENLQTLLTTLK